ncbi:hypothetical protein Tco_0692883 [Tanacetum coccineum]
MTDVFRKELQTNTANLKKELSELNYKEIIEESVKAQVVKEVNNILPQLLQKAVSDFATPVIQESITATVQTEIKTQLSTILPEAVSNVAAPMIQEALSKAPVVSTRSSTQPQSSYQATKDLTQFKIKKILMEKIQKSQSYLTANEYKNLYDALVLSYQLDKDLFDTYGQTISLKRSHEEDKYQDPSTGPDQGKEKKKRRTGKETKSSKQYYMEPSIGKSHSSTHKSGKSASSRKSTPREAHDVQLEIDTTTSNGMSKADDEVPVDPKPKRTRPNWYPRSLTPETPDLDWNTTKTINDDEEQPWFNEMINAEKPPLTFDELMRRPIDFSAYALNHLKLPELTRETLVGPVFNLLKGTCKSNVELEYHMEECFRALTDKLDWINPEGYDHPVDMTKPLPLQEKDGRLIIPIEVFFNNDLEYLKGKNSERTYSMSITKTPATRYTQVALEDIIPQLWSPELVVYDKDDALGISHWGPQHQQFYRAMVNSSLKHTIFFKQRILSVLSVQVEKKFGYGIILKARVEDVQLGVKSYQRKLNLTPPQRTYPDIEAKETYTLNYDPPRCNHNDDGNPARTNIKQVLDSILQAGNPVKEILLNLNLPDHSDEVLKLKNIKKDGYTRFQHQEQYEHVGSKVTSAQEGKRSQDDDKRLYLADDLKKLKIIFMSSQRYKSKPKGQ